MKVEIIASGVGHPGARVGPGRSGRAEYDGWQPRCVLGAPSPGGLQLPPAEPTAAWMYGPRGVWTDGQRVVAADTGNHRLLIWHRLPTSDGADADVVLGQPDAHTEGPAAAGRGPARGLHLPTGVLVTQGRLVVADAWHHRILVWDRLPETSDVAPDLVLGQPGPAEVEPNAGGPVRADTFYWPFGVAVVAGWFVVADTGNRRVLAWSDGLPEPGRPADVVLGQPDACSREENRGGPVAADSFRWPHAIAGAEAGDETGLLVADAGNHRVVRWDTMPTADVPADSALGQPDLITGSEFPYVPQAGRLRFPYGLATPATAEPSPTPGPGRSAGAMAVADTANNRVLIWDRADAVGDARPVAVLGQRDHDANGENRWEAVAADTFCWPYGLSWHRPASGPELIAVADSGNNRVVLWQRSRPR